MQCIYAQIPLHTFPHNFSVDGEVSNLLRTLLFGAPTCWRAKKAATSWQHVVVKEFGKRHDTTDTTDFCLCQFVADLLWGNRCSGFWPLYQCTHIKECPGRRLKIWPTRIIQFSAYIHTKFINVKCVLFYTIMHEHGKCVRCPGMDLYILRVLVLPQMPSMDWGGAENWVKTGRIREGGCKGIHSIFLHMKSWTNYHHHMCSVTVTHDSFVLSVAYRVLDRNMAKCMSPV